MGVRNCDTEIVMYSGRMDRSTVSIVPEQRYSLPGPNN
jgi:hypothetical protein